MASQGDSGDFGDLSVAKRGLTGMSSPTRGVFAGGQSDASGVGGLNTIEFMNSMHPVRKYSEAKDFISRVDLIKDVYDGTLKYLKKQAAIALRIAFRCGRKDILNILFFTYLIRQQILSYFLIQQ